SSIELDGKHRLIAEGSPELLFTENETNTRRLYGQDGPRFAKDGINDFVVNGAADAVNPDRAGTKAAARYRVTVAAGATQTIRLRLTDSVITAIGRDFDRVFAKRIKEADDFYETITPPHLNGDSRNVMRQSFAGLLWSKQFYHYVV